MAKLSREQIVTIEVLHQRGQSATQTARIPGVTEGAVRYHRRRFRDGATDGRRKPSRVERLGLEEAVALWWHAQVERLGDGRPPSVQLLHDFLRSEHGYGGSYKAVRKFVRARYGAPRVRPFRRVETPPGAQTQGDGGEFRRVDLGDPAGPTTVFAFVRVLSHSRKPAVVWSRSTDQLSWHHVPNEAYRRLGGVAAVNRIDNLKTGVARGCGAWGQVNEQYRVYARSMGFHVEACEARAREQKGKTERRVGVWKRLDVTARSFDGIDGLQSWTDGVVEADAARRVGPATGLSVAASWDAERPFLRPLPALLPEPFDLVRTAPGPKDCSVHFEGRRSVAPFAHVGRAVEVRGCSGCVPVVDPQTATVLGSYPRPTPERTLIDPACYEGRGTDRVAPPKPLGRMARKLAEIAAMPVERRPVDLYAALAEVAMSQTPKPAPRAGAPPPSPPRLDLSSLLDQLSRLGLDFAVEMLPGLLTRAVKEDLGPPALLEQLLQGELDRREERRVRTSRRLSGLPAGQTLANFDFAFQPAVERSKREALATCAWLREEQGLLILGPPGVGKTHLAVSLGVKAVECGSSVAFFRLEGLLHAMRQGAEMPPTRLKGKKDMKAALVIIDAVGFEEFTREEANLLFRLVSYRYQRGSLGITSNKSIKEWPGMLAGDEVITAAILDRLLHACHVLNLRGRSYRLRDLEENLKGRS